MKLATKKYELTSEHVTERSVPVIAMKYPGIPVKYLTINVYINEQYMVFVIMMNKQKVSYLRIDESCPLFDPME